MGSYIIRVFWYQQLYMNDIHDKPHVAVYNCAYYNQHNYHFCVWCISLNSNQIGHHGAASLAKVLPQCAQLQRLE